MPLNITARAAIASAVISLGAAAQAEAPDTIIVFDGSGSMWGQIDGRSKLEIARDTLSSVLSETSPEMRIGMIAYGHRQKGVCSDIETVVPVGPAPQAVPAIINAANALVPKGKTPLSDAVRIAAEELRYTENAATVVLVTDGIETCDADPCALAAALERQGIGFTAHVVGFGLSAEEGQQVQCLADETGGLYLSANDAEQLGDALRQTVQATYTPPEIPLDDADFGPAAPLARSVHFLFRDVEGGDLLGARNLTLSLEDATGGSVDIGAYALNYPESARRSASATLEPGRYTALIQRDAAGDAGYATRYDFEVPDGDGTHVIEAALSGQLILRAALNPGTPLPVGQGLPSAVGGSGPKIWFHVFAVDAQGRVADVPLLETSYNDRPIPLPNGRYLIRGTIDRTSAAEAYVEVQGQTVLDFSFDVTRVFVEAVEASGAPVKRQTTFWYDEPRSGRNYWVRGGGVRKGALVPFYMPTGTWVLNVGGEGYGKRRSELTVDVPGDYADIRLRVGEGQTLDSDTLGFLSSPAYEGCLEKVKVKYTGCLVKRAALPQDQAAAQAQPAVAPVVPAVAPPAPPPAATAQEPSLNERINRVYGILRIDSSGAPVAEISADFAHVQACQRAPLVLYPDFTIAQKAFTPPRDATENPYKTVASGRCEVTGLTYDCTLTSSETGATERLSFASKLLGNNHYALQMASGGAANAVACFTPGGELDAAAIMPNGQPLAALMAERADGAAPGFGYDRNNNLFEGN